MKRLKNTAIILAWLLLALVIPNCNSSSMDSDYEPQDSAHPI